MLEGCGRARLLIDRDMVEGIAPDERAWKDRHVDGCADCAAFAVSSSSAIHAVRAVAVQVPADLAYRTHFRVSLRAQEVGRTRHSWALWASFALSWGVGVYTAPAVWRAFEWAGRSVGAPPLAVTLAVGLWWAAPAAIAGGIWLFEQKRVEEE